MMEINNRKIEKILMVFKDSKFLNEVLIFKNHKIITSEITEIIGLKDFHVLNQPYCIINKFVTQLFRFKTEQCIENFLNDTKNKKIGIYSIQANFNKEVFNSFIFRLEIK